MEELTILAGIKELTLIHNGFDRPVNKDASTALTECLTFLESWFSIVTHNTSNSLSIRKATVPVSIPRIKSLIMVSYVPFYDIGINQVVILVH